MHKFGAGLCLKFVSYYVRDICTGKLKRVLELRGRD